jgi:hypothetical protein
MLGDYSGRRPGGPPARRASAARTAEARINKRRRRTLRMVLSTRAIVNTTASHREPFVHCLENIKQ